MSGRSKLTLRFVQDDTVIYAQQALQLKSAPAEPGGGLLSDTSVGLRLVFRAGNTAEDTRQFPHP
ncbi:MAG: hypothetical protein MAG453_00559 [Calditrichaeota bacterium]|nr:hypothetical protein [Calditrichota bacterium]